MLEIPQFLRQIDIVVVRVFKPLDFVPVQLKLLLAVFAYLLERGFAVNAFAVLEYGLEQLDRCKVGQRLAFPCVVGVENRQRPRGIDYLVVDAYKVGYCLSGMVFDKPVDLLKMRVCNLCGILAALYFGEDIAGFVFDCDKLVNAVEHRIQL